MALYAATTQGWHRICLNSGQITCSGRKGSLVSTIAVADRLVLATCPELAEVHSMMSWWNGRDSQESGAWLAKLNEAGNVMESETKIWSGNAKTCAIKGVEGEHRLFLGTEPADVLISDDMGATWRGTDSFAAIKDREKWTFPAKPHLPHIMSIDFGAETGDNAAGATVVMAGIEVGGALAMDSDGLWENRLGVARERGPFDLCHDVHQLRPDPFSPERWFAICGATQSKSSKLPDSSGGLFRSTDSGRSWTRMFAGGPGVRQSASVGTGQGYTVGMALNPERQHELLVCAGDKPPGIGSHIYLSRNGGEEMLDITESVAQCKSIDIGGHTAVPYFTQSGALLAFDNGQVAINQGDSTKPEWNLLCQLPGAVLSLCTDSRTPSSVIH